MIARLRSAWPLVLCLLLFALLVALANPLRNFPMGDDWEYARTVLKLLTTGQFYRSPVVQATVFFPALWGALFSSLLGFSFTTLRLSTLPLAAGTLAAFYAILGELGFAPGQRVLGTLTLMAAPLFVFNALSFMTDVPFLFWLLASLWCSLRGFRQGRARWVLAGSVCAALAFLTRQLGLALPAAAAGMVLVYRPRSEWPRWLAASLAVPLAVTVSFFAWQALARQTTWADTTISEAGTLEFIFNAQLPAALGRRAVVMLVSLNMYLLPLWLAFAGQARWAGPALRRAYASWWARAGAGLLAVFVVGGVTYFGARGDWWPYSRGSLTNAGLWPSLAYFAFPNDVRPPFGSLSIWIALTYLGAALAVTYVLVVTARLGGALRPPLLGVRSGLRGLWARLQSVDPAHGLMYASFAALLALVLVYPLFVERYFLPFLPGAIILLLEAARGWRPSLPLAALALAAMGLFSVGLMWDYFDWHAVRWAESQALVAQGLPLEKLDAGYEWSGWMLSDEAYAYINAHHVPVTADPFSYVIDPEYMVTFTDQPGYQEVQQWPFYNPFRAKGSDHLLLLKRAGS